MRIAKERGLEFQATPLPLVVIASSKFYRHSAGKRHPKSLS
jgi:hypothetical protein